MKRIAKFLVIAISSLSMFVTGCSNSVDGSVNGTLSQFALLNNNAGSSTSNKRTLNVTATTNDELIVFGESRLIYPEKKMASDLKFYLWGRDSLANTDLTGAYVAFTEGSSGNYTEGTVALDLSVSKYTLYLAAYDATATFNATANYYASEPAITAGQELKDAIFYGAATVDLRNGEAVKFYLSPNNLNGYGDVELTIRTKDGEDLWNDPRYYAEISIKSLADGTNVVLPSGKYAYHGATAMGAGVIAVTSPKDPSGGAPYDWTATGELAHADGLTYKLDSVPSGAYNLVVNFINDTDGKSIPWSDRIIVYANQETKQDVDIPRKIDVAPDKPTDFKVGYTDPVGYDADYYYATFTWTDNAKNEEYYVLQLLEVSGDRSSDAGLGWKEDGTNFGLSTTAVEALTAVAAVPVDTDAGFDAAITAATTAWEAEVATASEKISYNKYIYGKTDSYYAAGSLDKNNTTVTLKLPLGKLYIARLCAWNACCNDIADDDTAFSSNQDWIYASTYSLTSTAEASAGDQTAMASVTLNKTTANADGTVITPKLWPKVASDAPAFTTGGESAPVGISRYRIEYNLNDGDFISVDENAKVPASPAEVTSSVPGYSAATGTVIQYHTVTNAGTELISPLAYNYATTNYASLFNGDAVWSSWKKDSADGSVIDSTSAHPKIFRMIEWASVLGSGTAALNEDATTVNADNTQTSKVSYELASAVHAPADNAKYYYTTNAGFIKVPAVAAVTSSDDLDTVITKTKSNTKKIYVRANLPKYMASENLELFANYNATNAFYEMFNDEDYAVKSKNVRIYKQKNAEAKQLANYLTAAGTFTDGEIEGNAFKLSSYYNKLICDLVESEESTENKDIYRKVRLVIQQQSGTNLVKKFDRTLTSTAGSFSGDNTKLGSGSDGKEPLSGSHTMWEFEVPISSLTAGKYRLVYEAYTELRPDTPYTYVLTFELTNDSTTYAYTEATWSNSTTEYFICTSVDTVTYSDTATAYVSYAAAIAASKTHKIYSKTGSKYSIVPETDFVASTAYYTATAATPKNYSSTASTYADAASAALASANSKLYTRTGTTPF